MCQQAYPLAHPHPRTRSDPQRLTDGQIDEVQLAIQPVDLAAIGAGQVFMHRNRVERQSCSSVVDARVPSMDYRREAGFRDAKGPLQLTRGFAHARFLKSDKAEPRDERTDQDESDKYEGEDHPPFRPPVRIHGRGLLRRATRVTRLSTKYAAPRLAAERIGAAVRPSTLIPISATSVGVAVGAPVLL